MRFVEAACQCRDRLQGPPVAGAPLQRKPRGRPREVLDPTELRLTADQNRELNFGNTCSVHTHIRIAVNKPRHNNHTNLFKITASQRCRSGRNRSRKVSSHLRELARRYYHPSRRVAIRRHQVQTRSCTKIAIRSNCNTASVPKAHADRAWMHHRRLYVQRTPLFKRRNAASFGASAVPSSIVTRT